MAFETQKRIETMIKNNELILRSLLFVPGHISKFYPKALSSDADCIVFDIEDSVPKNIPTFCFYDKVGETPDPIIKNYINVLAFDDSEKVLDRIAKILNGEKAPQLTMEHKKLLNPFMDNNGLERFKSVVTDIIVNKKGFSKEQMPVNNP